MSWPELQALVENLGWTLVHFLWQGLAFGLLFAICRALTRQGGAIIRYRVLLGIFLATGLAPVLTFFYLWETTATGSATHLGTITVSAGAFGDSTAALSWWMGIERMLRPYLPWLVAGWLAGVSLMSGRVGMDWWQVRQLTRRGVRPLPADWEARVAALVADFGVTRPVRVLRSTIVRVPAVIGWLRPVILVPTAALTGLTPRQLELVIAHELAHIRRSDYLVNLVQVVVETLLFYHPVVSWMSNHLREEREHCCDDAVIGTCGDTLTYAHALTELEAQRQQSYQTALAASGGRLSQRIYRLLDRQAPRRGALVWSLSLVVGLAAASVAVATQVAMQSALPEIERETRQPALASLQMPATPGSVVEAYETAGSQASNASVQSTTRATPDPASNVRSRASTQHPSTRTAAAEATALTAQRESQARHTDVTQSVQQAASGLAMESPRNDDSGASAATDKAAPQQAGESAPERPAENRLQDETRQIAMASRPDESAAQRPALEIRGGRALVAEAPHYPRRARLRGLEGSVTAEFTIGRDGVVNDIRIVASKPSGVFDHAVESALSEWRFEPLYRDGEPVSRRVAKVFDFSLSNASADRRSPDDCDPMTGTRICRPWTDSERLNDLEQLRAR